MDILAEIVVWGRARPKGSKTTFITDAAWAKANREGRKPLPVSKEADSVKEWMRLTSQVMANNLVDKPGFPLDGPVKLEVAFFFTRPKSRAGEFWHLTVGDSDKLLRTVGDAGNGIAWLDDKQIAVIGASKAYTDGAPYMVIHIGRPTMQDEFVVRQKAAAAHRSVTSG